jgi:cobalt-zinc-cadmium efflux system protein
VGRLKVAFALIVSFFVVQLVVGLATHSLALLSDAGHMATDALGMGMAIAAITAADRAAHADHRTFGLYRLEILAALANAVLLFVVAGYVLVEAALRLHTPQNVHSMPVLVVGILGLGVNVVGFLMLRAGAEESLNVRGAYLEVLSDLLGSVGVIVAAILLRVTSWHWVDPVIGAGIGLFILPRAFRLGSDAVRVLVQAAPRELDVDDIDHALRDLDGVVDVHDLHVWTLTSEMHVLSAHLAVGEGVAIPGVLGAAQGVLKDRFGLAHATLQVEPCDGPGCDDLSW